MVLFLVMLILPIILWITGAIFKKSIDISVITDTFIGTKESPYQVTIRLRNRCVLPIPKVSIVFMYHNLYIAKSEREILATAVEARSEVRLSLSAHSEYCGISEFRISKVYLFDYLGLWRFRRTCTDIVNVIVLPNLTLIEKPLVVENPNVMIESDVFSATKSGDDSSELYGIRGYEQGDKMNRIHWKLSLKQDKLMVKQFGLPINCAVVIMVDFSTLIQEDAISTVDALMEALLSVSVSLILQEQIHYVIWYDQQIQTCQRIRIEHEEDIYEAISVLYRCKPYGMEHSLIQYHEAHYENDQYTNIYYLTPCMMEETVNLLSRARKSAITHVLLMSKEDDSMEEKAALHIDSMGMSYTFLREGAVASSLMEL
jgi:hypothetical protein